MQTLKEQLQCDNKMEKQKSARKTSGAAANKKAVQAIKDGDISTADWPHS